MILSPREILKPRHLHRVRTPTAERYVMTPREYEVSQTQWVTAQKNGARVHNGDVSHATPLVSGGNWVVKCDCGNAPSLDPAWRVAFCFYCGARYRDVVVPVNWPDIEVALLARPNVKNRHWAAPETVEDLWADNIAHGIQR